jgi:hypothetical protein
LFQNADLNYTVLMHANLIGAFISDEQLATCSYLNGATLPNGTKVPDDVNNPFR